MGEAGVLLCGEGSKVTCGTYMSHWGVSLTSINGMWASRAATPEGGTVRGQWL